MKPTELKSQELNPLFVKNFETYYENGNISLGKLNEYNEKYLKINKLWKN